MSIHLQIVTPERVAYKDEVEKVTLPTQMGEITILPNHIPLVANLSPGELVVHKIGTDEPNHFSVSGGFVEVKTGSQVIVLADAAEHIEEIDIERAEKARDRAKKIMSEERADDVKFAEAAVALERSLTRLRVARRKSHRSHPPSPTELPDV